MAISSVSFLVLALTALSQTTEQPTAAAQPGAPPAAEHAYSERERIEICEKKGGAPLTPSEPQPIKVAGKIARPKILRNVKPVYPGPPMPGTVILEVVIDEDGCVRDPRIYRGINRYQDSADLDAVRQWVFLPATLEGKPVSVNYVLTVETSRGYGPPPKKLLEGSVGWTRPADKQDEVLCSTSADLEARPYRKRSMAVSPWARSRQRYLKSREASESLILLRSCPRSRLVPRVNQRTPSWCPFSRGPRSTDVLPCAALPFAVGTNPCRRSSASPSDESSECFAHLDARFGPIRMRRRDQRAGGAPSGTTFGGTVAMRARFSTAAERSMESAA
jgi:TonB-like protein